MKWTKANWFKDLCLLVAFQFFFQTLLPTAHNLPMPKISWDFGPAAAYAQEPEWLASTVDANYEDRFIQEKLTEIGPGVDAAFAFVRDEIGFEAYTGSLRGARGTMWSEAGNSLDQASLLIALLRAQGIACRYVRGTLADEDIKTLILSMFNAEKMANAVGYIPPESHGTEWPLNDPENDPGIANWISDHWWVELEDGTPLDTSFVDAVVGVARGTAVTTHFEIPDELRHKVTVRLVAEFHNMLSQYTYKTPLEETFTTPEVYGKPLTIGNFINTYQPPALIGGFKTYTYSPYIIVEDNDSTPENNHLIQGEDYQEFFNTLIPMANSTLTRLTLEMEVIDPGREPDIRSRDLLDRVGYAARHGMAQPGAVDTQKPAMTEYDRTVLYITSGFLKSDIIDPLQEVRKSAADGIEAIQPRMDLLMDKEPAQWTVEDKQLAQEYAGLSSGLLGAGGSIVASVFILDSDYYTKMMRDSHLTLAYYDSPRLTLFECRTIIEGENAVMRTGLDLRRNHVRAIPYPGQNAFNRITFNMVKGHVDSTIEHLVVQEFLVEGIEGAQVAISSVAVFKAAEEQGILFESLASPADITTRLESMEISAEAKARISQALWAGKSVSVPSTMVEVDGVPAIGWYEFDPATGELISTSENGGRQNMMEFALICSLVFFAGLMTITLFWNNISNLFSENSPVNKVTPESFDPNSNEFRYNPDYDENIQDNIPETVIEIDDIQVTLYEDGSASFSVSGQDITLSRSVLEDLNQVFEAVGSSGSIIDFAGTNIECISIYSPAPIEVSGTVLSGPGITLETVTDAAFSAKTDDNQIPSAFRARISNTGIDDDFTLGGTAPAGWELLTARGINLIPAGITGEVSAFLRPLEETPVPAPGTVISFDLTAARSDNPAASLTQTVDFTMPKIYNILAETLPDTLYTSPDGTAETTISVTNTGNVAQAVSLTLDLPANFIAADILSPVFLDPGQSSTQTVSFTALGLDLDTNHFAKIVVTYGASGESEKEISLRFHVAAPGSIQALNAANNAKVMGRHDLADTLETLGQDISHLYQDQESETYKSRVVSGLENLSGQLDGPPLVPFAGDINTARQTISGSTPATMEAALDDLGTVVTDLENRLSALADHNFETVLRPNSAVALPETPTQFGLYLKNTGAKTTTYNLNLSGLPNGITGELNQNAVTIPPGYAIAPGVSGTNIVPIEIYATITQPTHELTAFDFNVTVTVDGAPEITRTAYGSFTARDELVEVVSVTSEPAFTDSGGQVNVSVRLLNAINQDRSVLISYTVKDEEGTGVFTSSSQEAELTVLSSLNTYDLGGMDTTGFELGSYRLEVTVTELDGQLIPGGAGAGILLLGSPITAAMSLAPETLPPGDAIVTTTLEVNSLVDYTGQGFLAMGLVDTAGDANSVAIYGNYAYVSGTENVTIVDISDLLNPEIVHTFAEGHKDCRIVNNHLMLPYGGGHKISIYSLDDPADPQLLGITDDGYDYTWPSGAFVQGNTAFEHTIVIGFSGSTIKFVRGDMLAYDVGNPNNPQLLDELYNTSHSSWPLYPGSDYYIGEGAAVNDRIALIPGTTETGTAQNGTGRILIVDISDPDDLFIQDALEIPGTRVLTGVAIQDNWALVLGNTGGIGIGGPYNTPILTGHYTLTVLDIVDPEHPAILDTITTEAEHYFGYSSTGSVVAGTNGFFAVSHLTINDQPVIMLVDASDPANMEVFTVPAATRINETLLVGNTLYTVSNSGLGIYDIGSIAGTNVTTQAQVPKDTVVSGSFNIEPDEIISGSDSDTLVWQQLFSAAQMTRTLTWQSTVTDLQPGEARDMTLGATVDFVASGTPGHIELPPLLVACEQILALTPTERTVLPGEEAIYALVVKNPTTSAVTYDLEVQGLPSAWVDIDPSVTVPAQDQVEQALTLQADAFAALGEYGFTVAASADTGARGTVRGTLTLEGFPLVDAEAHGIVLTLTPAQTTAGQGTAASFAVRLTNTGNVGETFILSADLPAGFAGSFGQSTVGVPPGLDNYREVLFTVTPVPGTAAGGYAFTVTATSATESSVNDQASGTVMVVGNGVDVAITPASGVPESTYQLTVTNTGEGQDTLDIVLGGPAGPAATLGTNEITLAAGASQVVAITLGEIDFAYEGALDLIAVATSRGDTAVTDAATAHVIIEATHGVIAEFDPDDVELSEPDAGAFLLLVRNTGNTDDAYTATITGTSGPVAASLNGLDREPCQEIPIFRLPGLATGAILLTANLQDSGQGTVTVTVTSQSNPEVNSSDIATLRTGNRAPVADAGTDQSVRIGEPVSLDGRASYDPDEGPSTPAYLWTFADKPGDSALTDADISDATSVLASFVPDVSGNYLVALTVSDGELPDSDEVLIQVLNNPPVADAGSDQNAETGTLVTLDGSASFDPDGDTITYDWGIEWNIDAKPAGSTLTDADIAGGDRPDPTFTPDVDGLYVFRLIVRDGWSESEPDYVEISATTPNIAPNADAGEDQTAYTGDWVILDGTGSNDPDSGPEPLTYLWTFKGLPAESNLEAHNIFDADQTEANFMPDAAGTYILNLSVYDGDDSDKDEVIITASYRNVPPNANAGADQDVTLGDDVFLDGSASDDPDFGPESLSFTWTFVSLPDKSVLTNADIFDAGTPNSSFTPDAVGSYVLKLEIFDGAERDFDNVMITVNPVELEPVEDLSARAKSGKVQPIWSAVEGADCYNVYRSETSGGPYTKIADCHVTDYCTYLDTDVVNGTTYYYVVRSVAQGIESLDSNEACATPRSRTRR